MLGKLWRRFRERSAQHERERDEAAAERRSATTSSNTVVV
jgi:hypothetical protein